MTEVIAFVGQDPSFVNRIGYGPGADGAGSAGVAGGVAGVAGELAGAAG